ncbi:hypothetical protein C8E89_12851 [Mycolicibacterium moriokaense]|uniref:Uncharacterized protein n=2 Tax=Mycolicibacterium moriokaense TaxID=39691 RepID=A0A318H888_9MYCO|nr:hypothetical protein C8E89_12851 [Mycolicibacterium moriokaense]
MIFSRWAVYSACESTPVARGTVSLRPSVGNGQQACMSHYYVRNNHIDWLPPISKRATQSATARDRAAHAQQPTPRVPKPWWRRAWDRIRRTNPTTKK